ncbi:radical SAM protein [Clostridium botulinum]|nr:radical SAM protein [Clostridium botulinum]
MIDSEIALFLKKNKFDISLSIDGNKYSHDLNRRTKNGNGSFYGAMNAIKIFKEKEIDFNVRMTIATNTIKYLKDNVKYLLDLGINNIRISPDYFNKWEDEFNNVYKLQYKELAKLYMDYKKVRNIKIDILEGKIRNFLLDGKGLLCNAGYGKFVIGTEGELYPCTFVIGDDKFKIGTIEEGVNISKMNLILDKYYDSNYNDCYNCKLSYFCQGSKCGYVNYKLTGVLNKPNSFICNHEKILYEVTSELVEELYLKEDKELKELIESLKVYVQVFEKYAFIREEAKKYFENLNKSVYIEKDGCSSKH